MRWPRVAFAFMLIMALVLAALSVTPSNVLGQGYVTITTQTTTTGLYTSAATTHYETTLLTTTPIDFSEVVRVDGTDSNPGTNPPCGWAYLTFYVTEGQHVSLSVESTGPPISFYVMSESARNNWRAFGYPVLVQGNPNSVSPCHGAALGSLIIRNGITSYATSLDFPTDATYFFWFINHDSSHTSFAVNFDMLSSPSIFSYTVSSVSYALASTTELLALTTAVSQVGLPFGNLGLLVAGGAVAVIAGVLVVARRRKPSVETALIQEPPATVQEAPKETVAPQPMIQSRPTPPPPVIPTKRAPPQTVIMKTPPIVSMGDVDKVASQPVTQPKVELQPIISTGYVDLDKALDGGIPEAFAVVLVSPSYDERDLLLRKVVNSAITSGSLAILISNDIGRTKDMASRYTNGFYAVSPQADRISQHGPNLLKIPSIENLNEASISLSLTLKEVLAREKATRRVMILDILSDLLLRYKSITTRRWLTDFVGKRKAEGFTIIATLNPLVTTKEETQSIIDFFDGVIEIFEKPLMERSRRFLMIRKMYGQKYSDSEVLMDRDKLF